VRTCATLLGHLTSAVVEASPSSLAVTCASSQSLLKAIAIPHLAPPVSENVPIPLVVSVGIARDTAAAPDHPTTKLMTATRGLAVFGLMEIEASANPLTLNTVILNLVA
jgi:hypothetical protein